MSFMELVFDPAGIAGFASGVTITTAVGFSGGIFRRKFQANGVSAKSTELASKFKPMYAQLEKSFNVIEQRLATLEFDHLAAYPSLSYLLSPEVDTTRNAVRENLNLMLKKLNVLDMEQLNSKVVRSCAAALAKNSALTKSALERLETMVTWRECVLKTNIESLNVLRTSSTELGERLTKAQSDYDDAATRFDRLFLESIPPALFKAEKAYNTLNDYIKILSGGAGGGEAVGPTPAQKNSPATALKTMKSLEKHLTKVLCYTDVAKSDAAKLRVQLRSYSWASGNVKRKADYNAALESLMEAESLPYDKGNPETEFTATIRPYRIYIYNCSTSVYR